MGEVQAARGMRGGQGVQRARVRGQEVGEVARWAWRRAEDARCGGAPRGAVGPRGVQPRASASLGSEAAAAPAVSKPKMVMVRSTLAALAVTSTCSSLTPVTAATAAAMGASTELQGKARGAGGHDA